MIILGQPDTVGKTECNRQLDPVVVFVLPVPSDPLRLPVFRLGQRVFPDNLSKIIGNAVLVTKFRLDRLFTALVDKLKYNPRIDGFKRFACTGKTYGNRL